MSKKGNRSNDSKDVQSKINGEKVSGSDPPRVLTVIEELLLMIDGDPEKDAKKKKKGDSNQLSPSSVSSIDNI